MTERPFITSTSFIITTAMTLIGLLLITLAQPVWDVSWMPIWALPVGYFVALFGAMAMMGFYIRHRAM